MRPVLQSAWLALKPFRHSRKQGIYAHVNKLMGQLRLTHCHTSYRRDRSTKGRPSHHYAISLKNTRYMKLHLHLKAVLCFAALLTGLQVLAYDFEANGLYYEITETPGTVSVTRNNDVKYSGAIVVPSTVKHDGTTYTVTRIGEVAFAACDITSIDMPNTITGQSENPVVFIPIIP